MADRAHMYSTHLLELGVALSAVEHCMGQTLARRLNIAWFQPPEMKQSAYKRWMVARIMLMCSWWQNV